MKNVGSRVQSYIVLHRAKSSSEVLREKWLTFEEPVYRRAIRDESKCCALKFVDNLFSALRTARHSASIDDLFLWPTCQSMAGVREHLLGNGNYLR